MKRLCGLPINGWPCQRHDGHRSECWPMFQHFQPCGVWMPNVKERCARRSGHGYEHRSSYAMTNARGWPSRDSAEPVAPPVQTVTVGNYYAPFTVGDEGPVQVGPWVSKSSSVRSNDRSIPLDLEGGFSYDSRAGSSSESVSIANVARVSATTRGAGDVASIEVVAR